MTGRLPLVFCRQCVCLWRKCPLPFCFFSPLDLQSAASNHSLLHACVVSQSVKSVLSSLSSSCVGVFVLLPVCVSFFRLGLFLVWSHTSCFLSVFAAAHISFPPSVFFEGVFSFFLSFPLLLFSLFSSPALCLYFLRCCCSNKAATGCRRETGWRFSGVVLASRDTFS